MTTSIVTAPEALTRFHFRPERGWLNDPNGMTFHEGRWHVFYQHNPAGPFHDRIAWGHVSSADLRDWRQHPIAFGPTPGGPDEFGCWTGVFVPGLDRPAMAYSGVADESLGSTICLRWGSGDLDAWGEPIVVGTTPHTDGIKVMRDPYVFAWEGRRWALLGAGLNDGTPAVLLYSCDDILDWHYEGIWLSYAAAPHLRDGAVADIFECPQLVWVDGVPVVLLSLQLDGTLDDVVAVPGAMTTVDGRPSFAAGAAARIDEGSSFYAPQVVPAPAGDPLGPLMFGWVRQGDLRGTGIPASGCLTLPRRLGMAGGRLVSRLDPAALGLAAGRPVELSPGTHPVPPQCLIEIDAGAGWSLRPDGYGDGDLGTGAAPSASTDPDTGTEVVVSRSAADLAIVVDASGSGPAGAAGPGFPGSADADSAGVAGTASASAGVVGTDSAGVAGTAAASAGVGRTDSADEMKADSSGAEAQARPGTRVFVDADVVEAYPGDLSAPVTVRGLPSGWVLTVPTDGRGRVTPIPGAG